MLCICANTRHWRTLDTCQAGHEGGTRGSRGYLLAEPDLGAGHGPHLPHVALLAAQGPGLAETEIHRISVKRQQRLSALPVLTRLGDDMFETLLS